MKPKPKPKPDDERFIVRLLPMGNRHISSDLFDSGWTFQRSYPSQSPVSNTVCLILAIVDEVQFIMICQWQLPVLLSFWHLGSKGLGTSSKSDFKWVESQTHLSYLSLALASASASCIKKNVILIIIRNCCNRRHTATIRKFRLERGPGSLMSHHKVYRWTK